MGLGPLRRQAQGGFEAFGRAVYALGSVKIITMCLSARTSVAVAASFALLAGCGAADSASPQATAASAPTAAAAGLAGDCKAATTRFLGLMKAMITGGVKSGEADEHPLFRKALTDYASATRGQAATVSEPALRVAMEKHAAAAEKLSAAADPTAVDGPDFQKASDEIQEICKGALTPTVSPGTPTVRLGASGSACVLPVAFDLVPLWRPKAIDIDTLGKNSELAELYRRGPFEMVCQVDGKPAGEVGNLAVYLAEAVRTGTPRGHLEAFVASDFPKVGKDGKSKDGKSELRNVKYTELTIGGQPAAEVTYEVYSKPLNYLTKHSAFALTTPHQGAVVVMISPFGADEYVNVLPAFELAKKSLSVNR